MENQKLNDQLKHFLDLNKCLQNETFRITKKLSEIEINADNSLVFKDYMDCVRNIHDQLLATTYDIRITLHEKNS